MDLIEMQTISANGILIWLAWGFFMGIGWSVATFLVGLPTRRWA